MKAAFLEWEAEDKGILFQSRLTSGFVWWLFLHKFTCSNFYTRGQIDWKCCLQATLTKEASLSHFMNFVFVMISARPFWLGTFPVLFFSEDTKT